MNPVEAPEKSAKTRQNPLLIGSVLLLAGTAVALIQYKIPTIMTSIMAMYSMGAEAGSWLMSIFTLMSIFVAVPSGILAMRFGAKRMMLVALGIAIVGSLLGAVAGEAWMLIVSRAVEGVALTLLTTCGPLVVQACVAPEKIGMSMGVWGVWGCVGSTIAAVATPTVFAQFGFEGVWLGYAAFAVCAGLVLAVVVKMPTGALTGSQESVEGEQSMPCPGDSAAGTLVPATVEKPRYREILSKNVLLFFVGFAVFNICLLAILSFVPTILQMQGFDPTLSGFISTAPMLLSIISSPLFGIVSDKIGRCKPLLVLAVGVMGPCTFMLYTNTGILLWAAVLVMGLIGMGGVGLFLSGYMKILPRPELASIGMGVMVLVQGLGQFLGSFFVQMLLGPSLDNWMLSGVVLMVLGFVGAGAIALCKMK